MTDSITELERRIQRLEARTTPRLVYDVRAKDASGNGTDDDTAAIVATIAAVVASPRTQGRIYIPAGNYKVTSKITVPDGVIISGDSAGTYINGVHTGDAIFDFTGTNNSVIEDIYIHGDDTTTPKTGILVARTGGSSGGTQNTFRNVWVGGSFDATPIYSLSGEVNYWDTIRIELTGGDALQAFYMTNTDDLSLGTAGASSLGNHLNNFTITNTINSAAAAGIYVDISDYFCGFTCTHAYIMMSNGFYVHLNVSDGTAGGSISFLNCTGEAVGGVRATGVNISGAGNLTGLCLLNCLWTSRTDAITTAGTVTPVDWTVLP
jgi:hypothetical protein